MNVKVIFNTNKKLKDAAMKKARKEGLTYSAVLNIATQAYVGDRLEITALDRKLEQARVARRILQHESAAQTPPTVAAPVSIGETKAPGDERGPA